MPQQQAAIAARGSTFVSAGAGTGKTTVLVERFARAVLEDGLDVDSLLVITYTERAAGELRARIRARLRRAGPARPRARPRRRRGSPRSTASAAGCSPRTRSPPASIRGSGSSTSRRRGCSRARPSPLRWKQFCAADEPDRWQLLATYRVGGAAADARQRLRHAPLGRPRADARARRAREPRGRDRRAPRRDRGTRWPTSRRRSCSATAARDTLDLLQTTRLPERLIELPRDGCAGRAGGRVQRRAHGGAGDRARGARLARPGAPAGAAHGVRTPPTSRRRIASRRSTSRTCSCGRVALLRSTRTIREAAQLRFRSVMVDEFQDTNQLQTDLIDLVCAGPAKELFFVGDEFQSIYGFRHADVAVFRDRRQAAPAGASADPELPLAARGARRRQRALRGRVRRELPAARAGRRIRRRLLRDAVRAARHRQGVVRRLGDPLAPRRGAPRRPARARARRHGRGDARRDRSALRRRHRRRVVRGGAPRASPCRRSG